MPFLLHRLVQERGCERAQEKSDLAEDLFSRRAIPSRKREAKRLFTEADGCFVPPAEVEEKEARAQGEHLLRGLAEGGEKFC